MENYKLRKRHQKTNISPIWKSYNKIVVSNKVCIGKKGF